MVDGQPLRSRLGRYALVSSSGLVYDHTEEDPDVLDAERIVTTTGYEETIGLWIGGAPVAK